MLRFYCNPSRWMEFRFKSFKYCLIFCNFSHFACVTFNNCCVLWEGPIEITGGGGIFGVGIFLSPTCVHVFFSPLHKYFLGTIACRNFLRQVSLAGISFGEKSSPPPSPDISNGPP